MIDQHYPLTTNQRRWLILGEILGRLLQTLCTKGHQLFNIKVMAAVLIMVAANLAAIAVADEIKVKIDANTATVEVKHGGEAFTIMRNQDQDNTVNLEFAKTSRECPPFCIQPAKLAPGVDTIGELEMLGYLQRINAGDDTIIVIDSRTPEWVARGTIPGSINIPWNTLNPSYADPITIGELLVEKFGVKEMESLWDFRQAKTAVLFCNGMWCGQSPTNINSLLRFGYPPHKLKWYRGGMQNWEILGLSTVKPSS